MSAERIYEKQFQLMRGVVNDFRSCRTCLDGKAPLDNAQLMFDVLNKAIPYTFANHPGLQSLETIVDKRRTNGTAKIDLKITESNWSKIQALLMSMDEGDLIEFCLSYYLDVMKKRRVLP